MHNIGETERMQMHVHTTWSGVRNIAGSMGDKQSRPTSGRVFIPQPQFIRQYILYTMRNTSLERNLVTYVRVLVLGVFLFTLIGTGAELILLEHTEDIWMWIPLALMGLGIVNLGIFAYTKSPVTLRFFRSLMVLFIISGLLGIGLHFKGNAEFEKEMYPAIGGFELIWESLKGATPALAPGTMIQLGLLGLIYTFKHPLLAPVGQVHQQESPETA